MKLPIALQLYSVREDCAADLAATIKRVAEMGYDGVEFAGFHGHSPKDIKHMLDDHGLKAYGTHTPLEAIQEENLATTIAAHHTLACPFVIVPWLPEETRKTEAACIATAERLTAAHAKLEAEGLRGGFHVHAGDVKPLENGKSAWDLIAAHTPASFLMQYDTANGLAGGADPVQPILDWPGRSTSLHLKGWGDGKPAFVGEGDIDWPAVLKAATEVGGTEVYVVEHEEYSVLPALEAVAKCRENLRQFGL